MIGKSMMIICVAALILGSACGPQYVPKPGTADNRGVAEERGKERRISLEDVPQPVKEAILAEVGDRKISEIEEVLFTGHTVYEAEWRVDGKEREVTIAADGTVLSRTSEDNDIDDHLEDSDEDIEDDDEDDGSESR